MYKIHRELLIDKGLEKYKKLAEKDRQKPHKDVVKSLFAKNDLTILRILESDVTNIAQNEFKRILSLLIGGEMYNYERLYDTIIDILDESIMDEICDKYCGISQ